MNRAVLTLSLAPAATLLLFLVSSLHPLHSLYFGDPDFGYLFNSLLLAEGKSPWHVDHPGTPLQLLGALLLRLRFLVLGKENTLPADLIRDPLGYLFLARSCAVASLVAAQGWCGARLYRAGVPLALCAFAQASPFLVWDGAVYLEHLSPETLLSAAGLCLVALLTEAKRPWATGLALALLATLKAAALPLLLGIFLFRGWRERAKALAAFALSYSLITLPIWPRLPWMLAWYSRLLMEGGAYGQPGAAFSFPVHLGPLGFLAQAAPLFFSLACVAGWGLVSRKAEYRRIKEQWPIFVAATVLLLFVLKHPAPRYLLALCPLVALCAARLRAPLLSKLLPLSLLLPSLAVYPFLFRADHLARSRAQVNLTVLAETLQEKYPSCHLAVLGDVAIPAFALYTGDLATNEEAYAAELAAAFPRVSFRQGNVPTWRGFGGVLSDEAWAERVRAAPCLVILARRDGGEELFRGVFGEAPRTLESVGPYGFYKVFAPPAR